MFHAKIAALVERRTKEEARKEAKETELQAMQNPQLRRNTDNIVNAYNNIAYKLYDPPTNQV